MFLSLLHVDVGNDPDRPRPGRLWLRNLYHVHQRLCMAFPTPSRVAEDGDFLKPFRPKDFGFGQVHVPRDAEHNFLFRIDPKSGGSTVILVQSALEPDWDYAYHNAGFLLAAPPEVKSFDPRFQSSQRLQFRILANPVRKVSRKSLDFDGNPFDERWHGKDVPVPTAELSKWLERRAEPGWSPPKNSEGKQPPPGFRLVEIVAIQGGYVYVNKALDRGSGRRLRTARYEGILEVTDADNFGHTLVRGIGPAKAFGFGLLSIAPVRS
jgi:CRISPR system Cascade subunit CasE